MRFRNFDYRRELSREESPAPQRRSSGNYMKAIQFFVVLLVPSALASGLAAPPLVPVETPAEIVVAEAEPVHLADTAPEPAVQEAAPVAEAAEAPIVEAAEAPLEEAQAAAVAGELSPQAEPPAPEETVLTLREAQEYALSENPSLRSVELRVRQAQARVAQARSAWLPQARVEYTAARTTLPDSTVEGLRFQQWGQLLPNAAIRSRFGAVGDISPLSTFSNAAYSLSQGVRAALAVPEHTETYQLSLQLNYLIFDGFAREFNHRAARFARDEIDAARRDAQRQLLYAVAQSYYGILLAKENIAIAEADVAFNRRLLTEAQRGRDAGVASLSDVLNFEVLMRAGESNLISAEATEKETRITLAALMGVPGAEPQDHVDVAPLPDEAEQDLALPEVEQVVAAAIEHRPDLEQARLSVERSQALVGVARSSFLPRVGAFASRDASLPEATEVDRDDFSTTVGLNASIDLFTGGRNYSRYREAKLARKQSERDLEQAELNALAEVRRAWVALEEAQQQLVLQRTTAELVQRNRDLVEKEYRAGQAPLVRLNEAQRDLIAAQSRLALARVGLFLAQYELRTATGESLLDIDID
jgi:outer membrane protein